MMVDRLEGQGKPIPGIDAPYDPLSSEQPVPGR